MKFLKSRSAVTALALALASAPWLHGVQCFQPLSPSLSARESILFTTTTRLHEYVPSGFTPEQYKKFKEAEAKKKANNLGRVGPKGAYVGGACTCCFVVFVDTNADPLTQSRLPTCRHVPSISRLSVAFCLGVDGYKNLKRFQKPKLAKLPRSLGKG
jgi:hypothetical protein